MKELNVLLTELGISKVRLAKYLGVSRQMLYNYLAIDNMNDWPKEKAVKLLSLLNLEAINDIKNINLSGDYIIEVEKRLKEGVNDSSRDLFCDMRGVNKKEQALFTDLINILKEKLINDSSDETYTTYNFLYHFIQAMETNVELKYILAYVSKSLGHTNPLEFEYDEDKQYRFESILFSAITMFNDGTALKKDKVKESHQRFVEDIEQKKEEILSRTQELNTVKVLALRELGFNKITDDNAKEVFEKIAEIQSRKV